MPPRHLVLVGGGHAHVEVLRSLAARPLPPPTRLTLISPGPTSPYSGMLPGVLEGLYARQDAEIDVAALARAVPRSAVVFGRAAAVNTAKGEVVVVTGATTSTVPYDVVSLDVGAAPGWGGVPGAAEWAVPVKPVDALLDRVEAVVRRRVDGHGRSGGGGGGDGSGATATAGARPPTPPSPSITVVGGGPGGAELAGALAARLSGGGSSCDAARVALPAVGADAVRGRLQGLGVVLLEAERVVKVEGGSGDGSVTLTLTAASTPATPTTLHTAACLWCTGAAAPAWLGAGPAPPPLDAHGFVSVQASLACSDDPASPLSKVFAVGDCAAVVPHPRPKAGVYAVRQGPPLDAALRAAVSGKARPPSFTPQAAAMALLSTGRRTAVGVVPLLGGRVPGLPPVVVSGGWVWRVKDAIDRRFVARYRVGGGAGE